MAPFDYNQHLFLEDTVINPVARNLAGIKLTRMLKALRFTDKGTIMLDLGCGVGSFTARIKEAYPDKRVIGIDVSETALALAARKSRSVAFACGDVTNLPFGEASLDAIGGFDILEHLENIDDTIREIHRALKPGGLAHFHIPCEGQPWTLWWFLWKTGLPAGDLKRKHAGHIQRFTHKGVVVKFRDHGLELVNLDYSVHIVGQILDCLQWWATSLRQDFSMGVPGSAAAPESTMKVETSVTTKFLFGIYRSIVRILEALSYYETKLLRKVDIAMAVDVTLRKE
jgi:ubiquinone/menaquinone biosynthesis C-methylase UbiE